MKIRLVPVLIAIAASIALSVLFYFTTFVDNRLMIALVSPCMLSLFGGSFLGMSFTRRSMRNYLRANRLVKILSLVFFMAALVANFFAEYLVWEAVPYIPLAGILIALYLVLVFLVSRYIR